MLALASHFGSWYTGLVVWLEKFRFHRVSALCTHQRTLKTYRNGFVELTDCQIVNVEDIRQSNHPSFVTDPIFLSAVDDE